jgi:hypothetical protein
MDTWRMAVPSGEVHLEPKSVQRLLNYCLLTLDLQLIYNCLSPPGGATTGEAPPVLPVLPALSVDLPGSPEPPPSVSPPPPEPVALPAPCSLLLSFVGSYAGSLSLSGRRYSDT